MGCRVGERSRKNMTIARNRFCLFICYLFTQSVFRHWFKKWHQILAILSHTEFMYVSLDLTFATHETHVPRCKPFESQGKIQKCGLVIRNGKTWYSSAGRLITSCDNDPTLQRWHTVPLLDFCLLVLFIHWTTGVSSFPDTIKLVSILEVPMFCLDRQPVSGRLRRVWCQSFEKVIGLKSREHVNHWELFCRVLSSHQGIK